METGDTEHRLDRETQVDHKRRKRQKTRKHYKDESYLAFGHINRFEKSGYIDRTEGDNVFILMDGDLETAIVNCTSVPTGELVATKAIVFGGIFGNEIHADEIYAYDYREGYMVAGGEGSEQRRQKGQFAWLEDRVPEEEGDQ